MPIAITETTQIGRSAAERFDFIADPEVMPQWAIHNVKAIRRLEGGRWEMDTPRGKAILVPPFERAGGILDHEFIDAGEGVWRVSARIVSVGPSESVYMITLPKHEADGRRASGAQALHRVPARGTARAAARIERRRLTLRTAMSGFSQSR